MTDRETAAVELSLTITTDDVPTALRLAEHLARTQIGYALDGHETALEIVRLDLADTDEHDNREV